MKKVSQKDRLEFWRFSCADLSIQKARETAELLQQIDSNDKLFYLLLTALYVFYGQPFKQKKRTRLPDNFIPDRFKQLHKNIIDLRDKSFAHVDYDGVPSENITEFNKILVRIKNDEVTLGIANIIPQGLQLADVISLCDELHKKCLAHLQKIALANDFQPNNGVYEIDIIQKEDTSLLKKLDFREPVVPPNALSLR